MPWIPPPVEVNPDAMISKVLRAMKTKLQTWGPWQPHEGTPEVVLVEEISTETAGIAERFVVAAAEDAIAGIGQTVFKVPPAAAQAATVQVRLAVASPGVVPAGFTVLGTVPNGDQVAFQLDEEVTAAPPHVDVTMTAVLPGAAPNDVPAGELTVATATAIVATAVALTPPVGGVDEETRLEYLDRLIAYITTLRPGGVRGADLALLARSVAGVHRALGVDLYDPAAPMVQSERTATIFPIDADGAPVSEDLADAVRAAVEAAREINFVVHIAAPTYTPVHVEFTAVAETGSDPDTVRAAVIEEISQFLHPSTWGNTTADDQAWEATSSVRYLDASRVAGSAPGVSYLSSFTINGGTTDLPLTGVAALPSSTDDPLAPSTVDGTVE